VTRVADIVVVGSGLVGATLAARLAATEEGCGLAIVVVDKRLNPVLPRAGEFDPRVVALTEASRQVLDKAGIWSGQVMAKASAYQHMEVRDGQGTGLIEFDCSEVHQPNLGHIVENSVVVNSALRRLVELENVSTIEAGLVELKFERDSRVSLILDNGEELSTPLVVAADGGNSRVREKAGFRVRSWDYGHSAIVTTITTARPHRQTAFQWFGDAGPLAFLPLLDEQGGGLNSSVVWSQTPEVNDNLMAQDDASFCLALSRASEYRLGEVVATARRFQFPLQQRHAVDYIQPGIALVGDAAHTIHPLAGQGVNLGFGDVAALVDEITRGLSRGLPLGHLSMLERYQRRRKPDNLAMMAAMEAFKRLFASDDPVFRILRNRGMSTLNRLSPVKNELVRKAMGF
jgi:2-polyprenylphenol 6-hydroxylase